MTKCFDESMIGKWVKEIATGDTGIIRFCGSSYLTVKVDWKTDLDAGRTLSIGLADVEFIDPPIQMEIIPEFITINGQKYKLTKVED